MARRPNKVPNTPLGITLTFLPHEVGFLRRNRTHGGMQNAENFLIDHIDPVTLQCKLDPVWQVRLQHYCQHCGKGGPNGRIRAACIPAFRRAGIELVSGWTVPD